MNNLTKAVKIAVLIALFVNMSNSLIAQTLKKAVNNRSLNYYEIQRQVHENNGKLLKSSSKKEQKRFHRWEWFWSTRYDKQYGYDRVGEVMRDYIFEQATITTSPMLKSGSLKSGTSINWTPVGPTSIPSDICTTSSSWSPSGIGRVESIWANPDITSTIYVGGMNGGLWKREAGKDWECLTDNLYSFGILDIAVNPSDPQNIYIATGCFVTSGSAINNGGYGLGVFFTEDGGNTWITNSMSSLPSSDLFMRKIVIDPSNTDIIYALSKKTVYKSIDGGYNWTNTNAPSGSDTEFIDMVMKPDDNDILYICARTDEIYKTTDAATTWNITNIANNLSSTGTKTKIGLAVTPADPDLLCVAYSLSDHRATLERSFDEGATWTTLVNNKSLSCRGYTPLRVYVSPASIDKVYVGGIRLYKYNSTTSSFDQQSFPAATPANQHLHDDIRDIVVIDNSGTDIVYAGHDGGVARSDDEAGTWNNIDDGLQIGLFYSISSSDADASVLIGGTHDCSSHIFDSGTWYNTSCRYCDGGNALLDNTNADIMYLMCNNLIYRSEDRGKTWSSTGLTLVEYDNPLLQHPVNNQTIYAGEWHPKVSYDKGNTWNNLSTLGSGRVVAMDISQSNTNVFYYARVDYTCTTGCVMTGSYLYRQKDDGSGWLDITSNVGSILSNVRITDIKINPYNSDIVWVTVGGLINGEKIYETKDGGNTWQNISYNLEDFPVQCLDYDEVNHCIYVGTDIGVFFKNINETTWYALGNFPKVLVSDLELNRTSGKLNAATFGRGIWEADIPGFCYNAPATEITSNTAWNTDNILCGDLSVNSGTLTITACITMPHKSSITVKSGATLIVDGGTIENANIVAKDGSKVILKNNAKVEINNGDELTIDKGAEFDFTYGEVSISSEK